MATAILALGVAASLAGCSHDADNVVSSQWLQVDAAQNDVYAILSDPMVETATPDALFDRLSDVVEYWDAEEGPLDFAEDRGTAIFYNFRDSGDGEEATFDQFVAFGGAQRIVHA